MSGHCLALAELRWMTRMVKVFGRRPSKVAREARGRRTETAQARTRGAPVRGYGDLRILLRLYEWCGDCGMGFTWDSWW